MTTPNEIRQRLDAIHQQLAEDVNDREGHALTGANMARWLGESDGNVDALTTVVGNLLDLVETLLPKGEGDGLGPTA